MKHVETEDKFSESDGKRRVAGFSKAERSRGADAIERRTAWLRWPLVYWAGAIEESPWPEDMTYRPAAALVRAALAGSPHGVYAVCLQYESPTGDPLKLQAVNPRVQHMPVSPRLVADALLALQASRRYPREIPKRVGDADAWRDEIEQRLSSASAALAALRHLVRNEPESLGLEAAALWVGSDAMRPTSTLPDAALLTFAGKNNGSPAALAAFVLGRRSNAARLPEPLERFRRLGARFASWPPDIGFRLLRDSLAGRPPALHSLDAVAAGCEIAWAGEASPSLLPLLSRLENAWSRAPSRLADRQWRLAVAGLVGRACAFIDPRQAIDACLAWLEACRSIAPGGRPEIAVHLAGVSLEIWLAATGWRRRNLEELITALPVLEAGARRVDTRDIRVWRCFVESHAAAGRLGDLTVGQRQPLFELETLQAASRVVGSDPGALPWFAEASVRLPGLQAIAARLATQGDRRLAGRLVAWAEAQAAPAESVRKLLDDVLNALTFSRRQSSWQFIARHVWFCDEMLRHGPIGDYWLAATDVLTVLRIREKNSTDLRALARSLLQRPESAAVEPKWIAVCSELAADDAVFLQLLDVVANEDSAAVGDPAQGWRFLCARPEVRSFLSQSVASVELAPRVWKLLRRFSLALRLQGRDELAALLNAWVEPLGRQIQDAELIGAYRQFAGETHPLPKRLQTLLKSGETVARELENLRLMAAQGALDEAALARLEHLAHRESRAGNPRTASKVQRECARALVDAKLAALEHSAGKSIARHWERMGVPSGALRENPDWENALHLYSTIRCNRRILRRLLLEEARGNREWLREHPSNSAFLESMDRAGMNIQAWLAPEPECHQIHGARWRLYAEDDPLKVLQMGNAFSTCLGVGGMNAFSVVANAVQLNKRVLFIRDERDRIVGRRLIGLGKSSECSALLVGFRSYGSCDHETASPRSNASPWVKILFDIFCLRLARQIGAGFTSDLETADRASETLPLFARWYNDGPETFDWWIADLEVADLVLSGDKPSVAKELAAREGLGLLQRRAATLRALIWLGSESAPLYEEMRFGLSVEELAFLERHSLAQ